MNGWLANAHLNNIEINNWKQQIAKQLRSNLQPQSHPNCNTNKLQHLEWILTNVRSTIVTGITFSNDSTQFTHDSTQPLPPLSLLSPSRSLTPLGAITNVTNIIISNTHDETNTNAQKNEAHTTQHIGRNNSQIIWIASDPTKHVHKWHCQLNNQSWNLAKTCLQL